MIDAFINECIAFPDSLIFYVTSVVEAAFIHSLNISAK